MGAFTILPKQPHIPDSKQQSLRTLTEPTPGTVTPPEINRVHSNPIYAAPHPYFGQQSTPPAHVTPEIIKASLTSILPEQRIYGLHQLKLYPELADMNVQRALGRYLYFNDIYQANTAYQARQLLGRLLAMEFAYAHPSAWMNDGLMMNLNEIGGEQRSSLYAATVLSKIIDAPYPSGLNTLFQGTDRVRLYNRMLNRISSPRTSTSYPHEILTQIAPAKDLNFLAILLDRNCIKTDGSIMPTKATPIVRIMVAAALRDNGLEPFERVLETYQGWQVERKKLSPGGEAGRRITAQLWMMNQTLLQAADQIHRQWDNWPAEKTVRAYKLVENILQVLSSDASLSTGQRSATGLDVFDHPASPLIRSIGLLLAKMPKTEQKKILEAFKAEVTEAGDDNFAHWNSSLIYKTAGIIYGLELMDWRIGDVGPEFLGFNHYAESLFAQVLTFRNDQTPWEQIYNFVVDEQFPNNLQPIRDYIKKLPLIRKPVELTMNYHQDLHKVAKLADNPRLYIRGLDEGFQLRTFNSSSPALWIGGTPPLETTISREGVNTASEEYRQSANVFQTGHSRDIKTAVDQWLLPATTSPERYWGLFEAISQEPKLGAWIFDRLNTLSAEGQLLEQTFFQEQKHPSIKLRKLSIHSDTSDQIFHLMNTISQDPSDYLYNWGVAFSYRQTLLTLFLQHPDAIPSTSWRPQERQEFERGDEYYTPTMHRIFQLTLDTLANLPDKADPLVRQEIGAAAFEMLKFGIPKWALRDRAEDLRLILKAVPFHGILELRDLDYKGRGVFQLFNDNVDPKDFPIPYPGYRVAWKRFSNNPPWGEDRINNNYASERLVYEVSRQHSNTDESLRRPYEVYQNFELTMALAQALDDKDMLRQGFWELSNYYLNNRSSSYADDHQIIHFLSQPKFLEVGLNGDIDDFNNTLQMVMFYKLFEVVPRLVKFAAPLAKAYRDGENPPLGGRGLDVLGVLAQMGQYSEPELRDIAKPSSSYTKIERDFAQEALTMMAQPNHLLTAFNETPMLDHRTAASFLAHILANRPGTIEPGGLWQAAKQSTTTPSRKPAPVRVVFRNLSQDSSDPIVQLQRLIKTVKNAPPDGEKLGQLRYWSDRFQGGMLAGTVPAIGPELETLSAEIGSLLLETVEDLPENYPLRRSLLNTLIGLQQDNAVPVLAQLWHQDWHRPEQNQILTDLAEKGHNTAQEIFQSIISTEGHPEEWYTLAWQGIARAKQAGPFETHLQQLLSTPPTDSKPLSPSQQALLRTIDEFGSMAFTQGFIESLTQLWESNTGNIENEVLILKALAAVGFDRNPESAYAAIEKVGLDGDSTLKRVLIRELYTHISLEWTEQITTYLQALAKDDPDLAIQGMASRALAEEL